jgi:hypothetical protein
MSSRVLLAGPSLAALVVLVALAAPAFAAPPPNDARSAPQALSLPATVSGTTVGATLDPDEPPAPCAPIKNSVWYSFTVGADRSLLVALDAAGDMDAVVELFVRRRSQLSTVECRRTNSKGDALIDADAKAGTQYLVRVAPLANSVTDRFTLRVALPEPPARPPGPQLPSRGTSGSVSRFANPDDAWSMVLHQGRTYRINLVTVTRGCVLLALYAPGAFGESATKSLACDDYTVFTPPATGRYTFYVAARRSSRASFRYRLRVGVARRDDTAPGRTLPDDHRVGGGLDGAELDALDLYRFTVARRSELDIRLRTRGNFNLALLDPRGRRLACQCGFAGDKQITRRLRKGHYYVVVRALNGARGHYAVSRLARVITASRMLVDGRRGVTVAPGHTVSMTLRVKPPVSGRATLVVERYDPLAGWLFFARHHPPVGATVAFTPPFVGGWRVTGAYDGTRKAGRSRGGTAEFHVQEPLTG